MLRSSLCNYNDAYILVSGTITVSELAADEGNNSIQVVFKNCALFTHCISEKNNTQIDNPKDIDVVMPMHNLMEYSDNYSKTSGSLGNNIEIRDNPALNNDSALVDFPGNSALFKFNEKATGSTGNYDTKNVEIMVPLKYLSNF